MNLATVEPRLLRYVSISRGLFIPVNTFFKSLFHRGESESLKLGIKNLKNYYQINKNMDQYIDNFINKKAIL